MGKPTIAAIDGAVRAGGMTIAISCDMIIAGDASTFGYPEIDVGLIPAIHFVQLPRLVGKHQAFGPLFLGDPFDAATAFRMGLLSEVVPKGTALDRAREIARRLAAKSPIVMKIGRDAFMRAVDADFRRVGGERGREFCACRDHRRLSGRAERVRREAHAELQGTLDGGTILRAVRGRAGVSSRILPNRDRDGQHDVQPADHESAAAASGRPFLREDRIRPAAVQQPLHARHHGRHERLRHHAGHDGRQSGHDRRQVSKAGVPRRHAEGAHQNHLETRQQVAADAGAGRIRAHG